MIKAIIFDLDGVLIDSEPLWNEAVSKVLGEVGVPFGKDGIKKTNGLRTDDIVNYWFLRYPWRGISTKDIEKKIVKAVVERIKREEKPVSGAVELVKFFAKKNLPMAIASSSQMEIINAAVEKISIGGYIKIIHSAERERFGKPHPDVYITAAEKLGVKPELCLVFEDSLNGVLAAKAARMKCVAVPDRRAKNNKNKFCIADLVIESLKDFNPECLRRL